MKPVRVVVIDDSAVTRIMLRESLSSDPAIDVVGTACDADMARRMIKSLDPDVVTLDIEMPGMNGLEFLRRLMQLRPTPVIMFASNTHVGSTVALQALELGAVDCVAKPGIGVPEDWFSITKTLIDKLKSAAAIRGHEGFQALGDCSDSDVTDWGGKQTDKVIAIGASTGGVKALRQILPDLPRSSPPVLIAQHMPVAFTNSFARRLNEICDLDVMHASEGMAIEPGCVYIVPGNMNMRLIRKGSAVVCRLKTAPTVDILTPSIDMLFNSVADVVGDSAVAILMTGMGRDGAQGLLKIRQAGGVTAAQDRASSLVFGMPKAAFDIDAAEYSIPLSEIAPFIVTHSEEEKKKNRSRASRESVRC